MASASGNDHDDARPVPERARTPRGSGSPTVRQRELGLRLRELRLMRKMTVEAVAGELLCSTAKISRLETGARRASLRDVRDLCALYQVTNPADRDYLMDLARQSREAGWWRQYDDLRLDPFIGLEQEASAITSFSMYYMPALLQTHDYAHAIIQGIAPKTPPKIREQRVDARLRRQRILEEPVPPRYRVLIDQAVLLRQVGGPGVFTAQLDKLLDSAESRKAIVQVVPFSIGAYSAGDSNFDILDFPDDMLQGPVVYVEGLVSNLYYERPVDIKRYREAVDNIRDSALGPRDSIALINELRASSGDRNGTMQGK
jgi:transcriptional regulator with XRE-family HTH domain